MNNKSSAGGYFKRIDLFRKLPNDMTQGTLSGGIISIIFAIFMIYLFIHEYVEYSTH